MKRVAPEDAARAVNGTRGTPSLTYIVSDGLALAKAAALIAAAMAAAIGKLYF